MLNVTIERQSDYRDNVITKRFSCVLAKCLRKPIGIAHYRNFIGMIDGVQMIYYFDHEVCNYHYWLLQLRYDFGMQPPDMWSQIQNT